MMEKKTTATVMLMFLILIGTMATLPIDKAYAQPIEEWSKTFGDIECDYGRSVQQTDDGGYIIAGQTQSFGEGSYDVYLVKTDSDGEEVWSQTYGGSSWDEGQSVQQTDDGGYIIAGSTLSFGAGDYDVYLVKTDSEGNMLWSQTYGGPSYDKGYSVQQTSDGGYIIAGWTLSFGAGESDIYLVRTDSEGNMLWQRTYGPSYCWSVQQTSDGGYIIAGRAGTGDVYLIKTDSNGNKVWSQTYGGSSWDEGRSVQQTDDGGYIIAGYTTSFGVGGDVYLVKTDFEGNEVWQRHYGGSSTDYGRSVQQTIDGGYIIVGYTFSFGVGGDVYLVKTNPNGDMIWQRTFGGLSPDYGYSVQQTRDGGYIIVGYTHSFGEGGSDVYLIKVEPEEGGFATGGGWIIPDQESTLSKGKAAFGFVAKHRKGHLTGSLEFQCKDAKMNLKSTSIDWLVISNVNAQFQGTAKINGKGFYTFRVQVKDNGEPGVETDEFLIKIWEGTDTEADPIHEAENLLSGGNIKIHK